VTAWFRWRLRHRIGKAVSKQVTEADMSVSSVDMRVFFAELLACMGLHMPVPMGYMQVL
jgi:hypothetical protein